MLQLCTSLHTCSIVCLGDLFVRVYRAVTIPWCIVNGSDSPKIPIVADKVHRIFDAPLCDACPDVGIAGDIQAVKPQVGAVQIHCAP